MAKKKYSEDNLKKKITADTPAKKSARTRSSIYGTGFYGYLPSLFETHYRSFRKMHDHHVERKDKVSSRFKTTSQGFINFILEIGPIPSGMKNPVLTRIHPRKGFIRGNLKWMNRDKFRAKNAARASSFAKTSHS
jgi:hypothetical protein